MLIEQGTLSANIPDTRFSVAWCTNPSDVKAAQHLRYRVFGIEMGANLPSSCEMLDVDEYDNWCDHLVVKNGASHVIGTYRVLRPERAAMLGKFYSDSEFDLSPLRHLRGQMIEVGRSCVDPNYRTGGVIMTLWSELAKFMIRHGYDYVLGCTSVPLFDGGQIASRIYHNFLTSDVMSRQFNVCPLTPLPLWPETEIGHLDLPPLIKGYLRLGAKICGAPALDSEFNSADFLTLLNIRDIHPRYAKHFFPKTHLSKH